MKMLSKSQMLRDAFMQKLIITAERAYNYPIYA